MHDPLFATRPTGPDVASWVAAVFRALHPMRWALGLVGLAGTVVVLAVAHLIFDRQNARFADWFVDPVAQVKAFADHLAGRSTTGLIIRLGSVVAVVAGLWSLVGGWIARHELLARHRGQPYTTSEQIEPGPTALIIRRAKDLVVCGPLVLALCGLLLFPVMLAGMLNHLGGVGAILVAILLPIVLLADLILLLLAVGAVAWPLMPVTIAAECSDTFDALSRAYNYTFMRPVRFVVVSGVTLVLSALPVAGALFAVAGPVENWQSAGGHPVVWAAAGLSASLFWSLQTLAYLNLRMSVDGTDANELARDGDADKTISTPPSDGPKRPATPRPTAAQTVFNNVLILLLVVAAWVMTARLFSRFGGEDSGWLGWGVGEQFRPPAEGLYHIASLLAVAWGFIWIAAPILVAGRRLLRPNNQPAGSPAPE